MEMESSNNLETPMTTKIRFNELRQELALPLDRLAPILGVSFHAAKAYGSAGDQRKPPAAIIEKMESEILKQAIARVRRAGLEVTGHESAPAHQHYS